MMKVIVVFKRLLASGNDQYGRHIVHRWNILGFNFNKRDALSSVYKISMILSDQNEEKSETNPLVYGRKRENQRYESYQGSNLLHL
jgi:hypothetical protein